MGDGGEDREDTLHGAGKAHKRQVEETTETLSEGPEDFYR
jgi:hypothetical protein